ncbi:MAG: hypothetical protein ACXW3O_00925 [Brevundimonas sp.]
MKLYSCVDVRLRSEIVLDELHIAAADDDREIVDVRLGPVPLIPDDPRLAMPGFRFEADTAAFEIPGVGRFQVSRGREIIVDPAPGGSERDLRLFLLGSALGLLCHQRGLLPLHANAVVVDDQAVAFSGHSGAGKSTLAAHFQRCGRPVLCDDVCVISFDPQGRPLAWPGLPRVKLWGDAIEAFGHDRGTLERAIEGRDKFHVPLTSMGPAHPVPLKALYVLSRAGQEGPMITRLQGRQAMQAVMAQTYRAQYLGPMGLKARHFAQCGELLKHIGVYSAARVWGFDVFDAEISRIEQHVVDNGWGRGTGFAAVE